MLPPITVDSLDCPPCNPDPDRSNPRERRGAWGRVLKIGVGVCAGLTLAYLIGMNAFLGTRWFRSAINFSPQQLRIEYARAYSILPGEIQVKGLSIRGSDGSVEWILKLDSCNFRMHFLDLLHRQFHASHVRGTGLSMRIRLRLEQAEATPEVVAALPPVPGFSDPPYLEIGPPRAPLTDAEYKLWSIRLDDVDAQHVRELWIHTLRYAGDMRVRGRWLFRPVRWLDIGPATIDIRALDVSYGSTSPFFSGLHGTLEATMHPFDVRQADGLRTLRYVSAKAQVTGLADTAEFVRELSPNRSIRVEHAEGPLDLQLVVEHGALRSGSRALISSAETEIRGGDVSFHAGVAAELRVDGEPPVARVDVGVSRLRVTRGEVELGGAASVSLGLTSRDVDLAHPSIETALFAVELNGARAPTVAFLNPFLPAGMAANSGAFRGEAHLEGRLGDAMARGQIGFTLQDLSVARGADRVGASAEGVLKLEFISMREGKVELTDSRLGLEDVVATAGGVHLRARSLALNAKRAVIQPSAPTEGTHPLVELSSADLVLRDISVSSAPGEAGLIVAPVFSAHTDRLLFGRDERAGIVSIDLPNAEVADLSALANRLNFSKVVTLAHGEASASLHAAADVSSLSVKGAANLVARDLRVQVGTDTYQGELRVGLQAHPLEVDPKKTVLSGSMLTFTSSGTPSTEAWWARVGLQDADVQLAGGTRFRATVHVTAENASPVQALLARVTAVPRWILDAFPTGDLHADGEIRKTPSSLEVRSVVAKSSGTVVQLEYAKHDADKDGIMLISSGDLRLGVRLAGDGQKVLLFGAESWFTRQVAALRAHENEPVRSSANP